MRSGDLTTGAAKLAESWKRLRAHWENTTQTWHDPVSREFEQRYLAALEAHVDGVLERMRALSTLSSAAQAATSRRD